MNKEIINDISEELESVLNEGRKILEEADLRERLDEARTEAELLIRKHPIKSVLAGAAAGFILAKLIRG
ncbi:MAG: hypothetical protein WDZ29_04850 [Balneolaceae bacterium]